MDKFKFILFSVITLSLLGFLGYWSIVTLQSGTEYKTSQKIEQLEKENEALKKKTEELKSKLAVLDQEVKKVVEQPVLGEVPGEEKPTTPTTKPTSTTVYKNQSLIDELEKLIAGNIILKLKSQGTKVGTVQKFLNIYNKTSNRVDNDYGEGTFNAVKVFQKDQGLGADGEAGGTTFSKMIDWLKK